MWLLSLSAFWIIPNRLERMVVDADLQASSPLIVSLSIRGVRLMVYPRLKTFPKIRD